MTNPNPWPSLGDPAPRLLVVGRYRVTAAEREDLIADARTAVEVLGRQSGFVSAAVGQSADDASLLTVTSLWQDAGAYRRALSSFDVKTAAVPLLSRAIDEPTAYELLHERTPEGSVDVETGLAVAESAGESVVGAREVGTDR